MSSFKCVSQNIREALHNPRRNRWYYHAIAYLGCVITASASAQTVQQSNHPLEQLKPTNTAAQYRVEDVKTLQNDSHDHQQIAINSIIINKVIPSDDGSTAGSFEPVEDADLQRILKGFLEDTQNNPTYGQIKQLTADLGRELRQKGEILSTVYIPAQTMKNATLELHLLQGTLGAVEVSGVATESENIILDAFAPYKNQVVNKEKMEDKLLRIQQLLPGITAQGSFKAGQKLGQSDAIIEIVEVDRVSGSTYLDNYGSETTGEFRLGGRLELNNLLGWEDQLRIDLLANETPDGFDDAENPIKKDDYQCCYGGLSYEIFSDSLNYSYGIEWSQTQYDIGNNADFQLARLGFSGESNRTRLFFNIFNTLSQKFSDTWTLGWSFSKSELMARNEELGQDVLLNIDQVPEWDVGYTFTLRADNNIYYGQVAAVIGIDEYNNFPIPGSLLGYEDGTVINALGQPVGPSRAGSNESNSVRLQADLNAIMMGISDIARIKGRLAMQISNDILAPSQQFSLAGPYGVRAYPSAGFLSDRGFLASVDVIFPVRNDFEISVFYDVGHGVVNDIDSASEFDATIQGLGLGLQYQYKDLLTFKVTAAGGIGISDGENGEPSPNIRNGGEEVTGRDDTQIFASLIYNF